MEEDRRNKEPKNMDARKRRAEYILKEEELKAACLAEGKDWEIEKLRWDNTPVALSCEAPRS